MSSTVIVHECVFLMYELGDKLFKSRSHTFVFIIQHGFLFQVQTWPILKEGMKEGKQKWQQGNGRGRAGGKTNKEQWEKP